MLKPTPYRPLHHQGRIVRTLTALVWVLIQNVAPDAIAQKTKHDSVDCHAPNPLKRKHEDLQKSLEDAIDTLGWRGLVKRKQLAVSLVDLSNAKRNYYAGINDDHMMYAASLPKIAILLAVVQAAKDRKIAWRHALDVRLQNMITHSSNTDATWGAKLVGLEAISQVLQDPKYCFYDHEHGGLWVGRYYAKGGPTQRDPLHNISHGSTTRQAARYYVMLEEGHLVSPHWSFRMMGLMSPPGHFHKFVGALKDRPGIIFRARKSGSWRHFHSDSALIEHYDNRYVLIGMSEHPRGEQLIRKLAETVDDLIMEGAHRQTKPKKGRKDKRTAFRN